jgi:hypothetical protein
VSCKCLFVQVRAVAAGGQSPLLRCLSQLNDDVLTACLLPKLKEQGSTGAVALTCSQLRRLCQDSTHHLDLSQQPQDSPCSNPALAQQLIAAFPQCTSLKAAWDSNSIEGVHRHISTLLEGWVTVLLQYVTAHSNMRLCRWLRAHIIHIRVDRPSKTWQLRHFCP